MSKDTTDITQEEVTPEEVTIETKPESTRKRSKKSSETVATEVAEQEAVEPELEPEAVEPELEPEAVEPELELITEATDETDEVSSEESLTSVSNATIEPQPEPIVVTVVGIEELAEDEVPNPFANMELDELTESCENLDAPLGDGYISAVSDREVAMDIWMRSHPRADSAEVRRYYRMIHGLEPEPEDD